MRETVFLRGSCAREGGTEGNGCRNMPFRGEGCEQERTMRGRMYLRGKGAGASRIY